MTTKLVLGLICSSYSQYQSYMLTLRPLACIEGSRLQTGGSIWNYATGTLSGVILKQSCYPP